MLHAMQGHRGKHTAVVGSRRHKGKTWARACISTGARSCEVDVPCGVGSEAPMLGFVQALILALP